MIDPNSKTQSASQNSTTSMSTQKPTLPYDGDRLMAHVGKAYDFHPTDSDDYTTAIDTSSGMGLSWLGTRGLLHCNGFLTYNVFEHDYSTKAQVVKEYYAADDTTKPTFCEALVGGKKLCFLRELAPINQPNKEGQDCDVKFTLFLNSVAQIADTIDSKLLSYGLEKNNGSGNPNEYKVRLKLLEKSGRYFFSEEPFDCYLAELNLQGVILKVPVVITHHATSNANKTLDEIKTDMFIDGIASLQGSF